MGSTVCTIEGHCFLERHGYSERKTSALAKIPTRIQETMHVSPIPRNMHVSFHIGWRQAQAQALVRKYENHPNVLYVDAESTARSTAFVTSVVDNHGTEINAALVSRASAVEAKELALALTIRTRPHWECVIVLTDSQMACRNFFQGQNFQGRALHSEWSAPAPTLHTNHADSRP